MLKLLLKAIGVAAFLVIAVMVSGVVLGEGLEMKRLDEFCTEARPGMSLAAVADLIVSKGLADDVAKKLRQSTPNTDSSLTRVIVRAGPYGKAACEMIHDGKTAVEITRLADKRD